MNTTPASSSAFRRVLVVVGLVAIVAVGGRQLSVLFNSKPSLPLDFVEYWTAGYLNATGENPYSAANVRAVQQWLGWNDTAIMMWNPPWVLTVVMPIGLLPVERAYTVWLLLHIGLLMVSTALLWRGFGGPPRQWWLPQLIALSFGPSIFLLGSGQITTLMLLGLAGFLYFAKTNRPILAGVLVSLTAVKPHLLILFALWLLVGSLRSSFARRVVLGGLVVGLVACILPTLANPHVWGQYNEAIHGPSSADHHHVAFWKPPVIGWWLRQVVPGNPFEVQWLPLALALMGCLVLSIRQRVTGEAKPKTEQVESCDAIRTSSFDLPDSGQHVVRSLPFIVGYSLLVSPYGAWAFDLVLLLVPVLAIAAQLARTPVARAVVAGLLVLASINAVSLVMMVNRTSSEWYVWVVPCVLLGTIAVKKLSVSSSRVLNHSVATAHPSPVGA